MKFEEFESNKKIKESLKGAECISNINNLLNVIGLGSKKLEEILHPLDDLKVQFDSLMINTQKFNDYFSSKGWISYGSLNGDLIIEAVNTYESGDKEKAENIILEYYKPENITNKIMTMHGIPELHKRFKFIEFAFNDYKESRFYSVIPLLLMIIDGTVSDIIGKGLHSEKTDLNVWESMTNIDNGIDKIREIFSKGRYKTTDDEITLPYRNGILHGIDLGYDNYKVAAKCWQFLFVIKDWGQAKHTEEKRKLEFENKNKKFDFGDYLEKSRQSEKEGVALDSWKPRTVDKEYFALINKKGFVFENVTPEKKVIEFLSLWKSKNYGEMSKLFWVTGGFFNNPKSVRNEFANGSLVDFKIISIEDSVPAISIINVMLEFSNEEFVEFVIRLIYQDSDGQAKSSNLPGFNWAIIFCLKKI